MADNISVTVLTKNSEVYLHECLRALSTFSEVVVLDNGSSDRTLEIARSFPNVRVYEHPFIGFGPMKNLAVLKASNDWILSIDSDEIVSRELVDEIDHLELSQGFVYDMERDNFYHGRLIKGCGWEHDRVQRLFNRTRVRFNNSLIHEGLEIDADLKIVSLRGHLKHYSFDNVAQLLHKMQHYSTLWAEENLGKRKTSPCIAVIYGIVAFLKSYVLKKGWRYGYEGLVISISNANGVFYKYIKLYENERFKKL